MNPPPNPSPVPDAPLQPITVPSAEAMKAAEEIVSEICSMLDFCDESAARMRELTADKAALVEVLKGCVAEADRETNPFIHARKLLLEHAARGGTTPTP